MGKAKIQIVEDERIVAEDMRQFLEAAGYEVCGIAKDNPGALRLAEEHRPDIVLMDIVIRGELDGIDTAAMIRERFGIPVIYLTAYSQEGVLARAKPTQPLAYLVKPFKESALLGTLEMALHKSALDAQMAESRELLHITLKSIGDGVISTGTGGDIVFMNAVAEGLTGWRFSEAKGRPVSEVFAIINPDSRETIDVPCMVAMETGVVCTLERGTVLVRKDGSEVAVDDSGAPIHNAEGELTGSVLVFRDVSADLEREKRLSDYREQLEVMVEERTVQLERRISLETTVAEVGSALIHSCIGAFE